MLTSECFFVPLLRKNKPMAKIYLTVLLIFCLQVARSQNIGPDGKQDSLVITMQQAEDSFLTNNLSLIARKYSIDSAKATVITAKLYDNPEFDYSNAFY